MSFPVPDLPLDECVEGASWACWSEMVLSHPSLLVFLTSRVRANTSDEEALRACALRRWMKASGLWLEDQDESASRALANAAGLKEGALASAAEQVESTDGWYRRFLDAERAWFAQAPEAPLVVVHFQPQYDPETGQNEEMPATERWNGTQALLEVDVEGRDAACENDSYESDDFRTASGAPAWVADWDGPFAVSVAFHAPSAMLRAQRAARQLDGQMSHKPLRANRARL